MACRTLMTFQLTNDGYFRMHLFYCFHNGFYSARIGSTLLERWKKDHIIFPHAFIFHCDLLLGHFIPPLTPNTRLLYHELLTNDLLKAKTSGQHCSIFLPESAFLCIKSFYTLINSFADSVLSPRF